MLAALEQPGGEGDSGGASEIFVDLIRSEKAGLQASIDKLQASIADMVQRVEHIRGQALEQVASLEEEAKKVAMV